MAPAAGLRGSEPFSSHCEPLYNGTVVELQMIANIKSQVEQIDLRVR